jgi:hypothetical protein
VLLSTEFQVKTKEKILEKRRGSDRAMQPQHSYNGIIGGGGGGFQNSRNLDLQRVYTN